MAVAEFLENVDLGALGLGESEKKVLRYAPRCLPPFFMTHIPPFLVTRAHSRFGSTADLTPIPIARPNLPESPIAVGEEHPASLRGRVEQGVDAIAGSANKVILGVVDTSFGVLRALLPGQTAHGGSGKSAGQGSAPGVAVAVVAGAGAGSGSGAGETDAALWGVRPSLGLLRRETGFSIAGLTVTLPGGPGKAKNQSQVEEEGQRELIEVPSKPASLKSHRSGYEAEGSEDIEGSSEGDGESTRGDGESEEQEEQEEGREDGEAEGEGGDGDEEEEEVHDARSIKSFESMLSSGRTKRKTTATATTAPLSASALASASTGRRKRLSDLTDRLTHGMAGMSRRVQGGDAHRALTLSGQLPPPNRRFMECTEQDIRVSEVGELLREYQRLVEAVRSVGGFQE